MAGTNWPTLRSSSSPTSNLCGASDRKMPTVGGVLRADAVARADLLHLLCGCRENVIWWHARHACRHQSGPAAGGLQPGHVPGADRGADPRRRGVGPRRGHRTRRAVRQRAGPALGRAGRPQPADPAHPRPLRSPCRRGRIRPRLPRADEGGDRPRPARGAVGRRPAGLARRARRQDLGVDARARPHLPDLDDLRRRAGAAQQPRTGGGLRAAAGQPRVRPRTEGARHQGRHHRGHVDDREAGRLRRPRRHHASHAERRRQLQPHRPQVVHLGADVRHLPRAGPGTRAD